MLKLKSLCVSSIVAIAVLFIAGCNSLAPESKPYAFISQGEYSPLCQELYYSRFRDDEVKVKINFSTPPNAVIKFACGYDVDLSTPQDHITEFTAGVYPFQLKLADGKTLSGAIMIHGTKNNQSLELATLGIGKGKEIFSPELIDKASNGTLAKYSMKFDEKEVLFYWLGNRQELCAGGNSTVELDFSANENINALYLNEKKMESTFVVIETSGYNKTRKNNIAFKINGKSYSGYIQDVKDNEFSAFVKVPCVIPKELLRAADDGTVAKFIIMSQGDKREKLAQLIFSRCKDL